MAALPPIRRILKEGFEEQSSWISGLLDPINRFFDSVVSAMDRNLTIKENFSGDMRTVTVDGTFPVKLSWDLKAKPVSVLVGQVSPSVPRTVQAQWSFNQSNQLQLDSVSGILPTSRQFLPLDVNTGTEEITLPLHEFTTGDKVRLESSGTAPAGLVSGQDYYCIVGSKFVIKLASNRANALAGTAINLTSAGTGYHTLTSQYSAKYQITLEIKTG